MRPKITAILFIPMLFLLTAAAFVLAQQTGSISGRILDSQTQLPLAGVSVHVVGTSRGANTDLDGKFSILRLAPATYSLRITQIGYTSVELKNIEVKPGLNSEVNTSLTTAKESLDEKITVEAELDFVDKFEVSGKSTVTRSEQQNSPTEFAEVPTAKEKRIEYKLQSQTIVCDSIARVNRSPKHQSFDRPCYPTNPYSQGFEDMIFEDYGTNPFVLASEDYQSTFAIDIDDASYVLTRSFLSRSELPPSEAVRVEEFINHFNYNYEPPSEDVFNIFMEGSPSRFGSNSKILRIGIQGKEIDVESRKPSNVTFVVDVSGSMNESNKYSLVIEALKHIINHLYVSDRVCIVSYNQHAKVILKPISLRYRTKILSSLDKLRPYGSTNVEAGLKLGYKMAWQSFNNKSNNSMILLSDGVANVGRTEAEDLLNETRKYAQKGITLSSIGVGMHNYNDVLLEKLGDKGNGFYAYIDDMDQARRVFNGNLAGALQLIARDVKIQVEFDPEQVYSYRLVGYENRAVNDYNFRNDRVDGGEIGPGHSVTALYEIYTKRSNYSKRYGENYDGNIGRVFIRYKNPESGFVEEINSPIKANVFKRHFNHSSSNLKLAACAAEFAEIMRDSYWARYSNLDSVLRLAKEVYHETEDPDVLELIQLVSRARKLRNLDSDYFSRE